MPPYLYVENGRATEKPTATTPDNGGPEPGGPFWRGGAKSPSFDFYDVLPQFTRRSVEFIRKNSSKPFFLYVPMTGPHTPWMPLAGFRGKSGAGEYGDFVLQVDDSVRQILEALDRAGVAGSTMVVFASDNGSRLSPAMVEHYRHRSHGPWRGMKADIYEAGHRVPFIVRWPGRVKAGSVNTDPICLNDFMATAAEAAGARLPADAAEDSFSLLPALLGKPAAPRDGTVHQSSSGDLALRQGEWKLIFHKDGRRELFHIASDLSETTDVLAANGETAARLAKTMERFIAEGRSNAGPPQRNDVDVKVSGPQESKPAKAK
jgi:arylsulfatase A-like enzyme